MSGPRDIVIAVQPTPKGFKVIRPGLSGGTKLGIVSHVMEPFICLHLARQAAALGSRLMFEVVSDGGPAGPFRNEDIAAWEAE